MSNREREIRLQVLVNKKEDQLINQKMAQIGTTNFSMYARKMLIDGYVIKHDFKELRTLTAEIGKIGSNLNQIAKRANETRNIQPENIKEVLKMQHELQILISNKVGKLIGKK